MKDFWKFLLASVVGGVLSLAASAAVAYYGFFLPWWTRRLGESLDIDTGTTAMITAATGMGSVQRFVDAHYQLFWGGTVAVTALVFAVPMYGIWVNLIKMRKSGR